MVFCLSAILCDAAQRQPDGAGASRPPKLVSHRDKTRAAPGLWRDRCGSLCRCPLWLLRVCPCFLWRHVR